MNLIPNASMWHRLWSVRMAIIGVIYSAAGGAWLLMPTEWQPTLAEPVRWVLAVIGVSLAASPGVARVVEQPKLREPQGDDDNAEHA